MSDLRGKIESRRGKGRRTGRSRVRKRWANLKKISRQELRSFYNLILEVVYCCFYYMLLVIQTIPGRVWEGPTKGINLDISGDHVRGCLPSEFTRVL